MYFQYSYATIPCVSVSWYFRRSQRVFSTFIGSKNQSRVKEMTWKMLSRRWKRAVGGNMGSTVGRGKSICVTEILPEKFLTIIKSPTMQQLSSNLY